MGKPRPKRVVGIAIALIFAAVAVVYWLYYTGVIVAGVTGYCSRVHIDGIVEVLNDGRVAVGVRPGLLQLSDPDGNLLWRKRLPGCNEWITGVDCATDGTIYAFAWDGALYSLDKDGRLNWKNMIRPPFYVDDADDRSHGDCEHAGIPVVINENRIMVVIRGYGCGGYASWVDGIYDASGEVVCSFNRTSEHRERDKRDPVYSVVRLGGSEDANLKFIPDQWCVCGGEIAVYGDSDLFRINAESGEFTATRQVTDSKLDLRTAARDKNGNSYVLGNLAFWQSKNPKHSSNPPGSVLTAYDDCLEEKWHVVIPSGVFWVLTGNDGYIVVAGIQDQFGIVDGEIVWRLESGIQCWREPVLCGDDTLRFVNGMQGGYVLKEVDRSGQVVKQQPLPYTDERMRFAFSAEGTLYAVSRGGSVEVVE